MSRTAGRSSTWCAGRHELPIQLAATAELSSVVRAYRRDHRGPFCPANGLRARSKNCGLRYTRSDMPKAAVDRDRPASFRRVLAWFTALLPMPGRLCISKGSRSSHAPNGEDPDHPRLLRELRLLERRASRDQPGRRRSPGCEIGRLLQCRGRGSAFDRQAGGADILGLHRRRGRHSLGSRAPAAS